jgi:hypothetical protein
MSQAVKVEVRELRPELLDDYLRFFDQDAFTDFPEWSGCYCGFYDTPQGMSGTLQPKLARSSGSSGPTNQIRQSPRLASYRRWKSGWLVQRTVSV